MKKSKLRKKEKEPTADNAQKHTETLSTFLGCILNKDNLGNFLRSVAQDPTHIDTKAFHFPPELAAIFAKPEFAEAVKNDSPINFSSLEEAQKDPTSQAALITRMMNLIAKGVPPKDVLGITSAHLEGLYNMAFNLYNAGKYEDAEPIFQLLTLLDNESTRFVFAHAACLHRLKRYVQAANVYMISAVFDQKNPAPHFYAADCYLKLKDPFSAIGVLGVCTELCGKHKEHAQMKQQAELTIQAILKKIKGIPPEKIVEKNGLRKGYAQGIIEKLSKSLPSDAE